LRGSWIRKVFQALAILISSPEKRGYCPMQAVYMRLESGDFYELWEVALVFGSQKGDGGTAEVGIGVRGGGGVDIIR